jgi:hypothetical protein
MRIRLTWVFTVDSSITSSSTISLFESPRATLGQHFPFARGAFGEALVVRSVRRRLARHAVDHPLGHRR